MTGPVNHGPTTDGSFVMVGDSLLGFKSDLNSFYTVPLDRIMLYNTEVNHMWLHVSEKT